MYYPLGSRASGRTTTLLKGVVSNNLMTTVVALDEGHAATLRNFLRLLPGFNPNIHQVFTLTQATSNPHILGCVVYDHYTMEHMLNTIRDEVIRDLEPSIRMGFDHQVEERVAELVKEHQLWQS